MHQENIIGVIFKWFRNKLLPDFTNKLTWYVVGIGSAFLLIPVEFYQLVFVWLVETLKLRSNVPVSLADIQVCQGEQWIGFWVIVSAITHNIIYQHFKFKESALASNKNAEIEEVDKLLFMEFLNDFPTNSGSVSLLKEHNFINSFHSQLLDGLDVFVYCWNAPEKQFLDDELEKKRKVLWDRCREFLSAVEIGAYPLNGGPLYTCIPDGVRGAFELPEHVNRKIEKLNTLGTDCFELHREFITFTRKKLRC